MELKQIDQPLVYQGRLSALLEQVYLAPGDRLAGGLAEQEVEIGLSAQPGGTLRISTELSELPTLAELIAAIPGLSEHWVPQEMFAALQALPELGLNRSRYQEPALMMIGVPGIGAAVPTSLLLGMPFAYPPVPPTEYRQLYFADPDDDHSHSGHGH